MIFFFLKLFHSLYNLIDEYYFRSIFCCFMHDCFCGPPRRSTEISLVIRQTMEECILTNLMPHSLVCYKSLGALSSSQTGFLTTFFVDSADRYFCTSSTSRWRLTHTSIYDSAFVEFPFPPFPTAPLFL